MADLVRQGEPEPSQCRWLFVRIEGLIDDHFTAVHIESTENVGHSQPGAEIVEAEMKAEMILEDALDRHRRPDLTSLPPGIRGQQRARARLDGSVRKVGHLQVHRLRLSFSFNRRSLQYH